jgi:hypothetical protein
VGGRGLSVLRGARDREGQQLQLSGDGDQRHGAKQKPANHDGNIP